MTLQLHLPNKQLITFKKSDNLKKALNNDCATNTILTEYFI